MKIFFIILGCIIIISGAVISAFMLISRQIVIYYAWEPAIVFAASLLISAIPFGMAVILARLEKAEHLQREGYNLLERKVAALAKTIKILREELSEDAKVHRLLYEGTSMAKDTAAAMLPEELFDTLQKEHETPSQITPFVPLHGVEPLSKQTYKGMTINKIVRIILFYTGIICLLLSAFYLFQLIFQERWEDTNVRIPQLIQFFGGMIFIALGRILKNQEKIICLSLKRKNDIGNDERKVSNEIKE